MLQAIKKLATGHGVSIQTIQSRLRVDLDLTKWSARWVPKLLNREHMEERVRTGEEFLVMVCCSSLALLDCIVNMDELAVSFHRPEMKQQSKQWTKLIYTSCIPRGKKGECNADDIVEAPSWFLASFKQTRPAMAARDNLGQCSYSLGCAEGVERRPRASGSLSTPPPPCAGPGSWGLFSFPSHEEGASWKNTDPGELQVHLGGATRRITVEDLATAFQRW